MALRKKNKGQVFKQKNAPWRDDLLWPLSLIIGIYRGGGGGGR